MTAKQINEELDDLDEGNSEVNEDFVADGRGRETPDETRRKAKTNPRDLLAIAWVSIRDRRADLQVEIYVRAKHGDGSAPRRLPEAGYGPREKRS